MNVRQFRRIWCLTLTAVLLFSAAASAAEQAPVFVRIKLTRGSLYVHFKGEEMRIATSVKELKEADPIVSTKIAKSSRGRYIYFPETTLPIPEKDLPSGATEITAEFILQESSLMVYGTLSLSLKDKNEVEWTYKWRISKKASKSPSSAAYIKLPELKKLSLGVVTQANSKQKRVAVGLRLKAGNTEMVGVYKDGAEVKAHVGIINTKGEKIVSGNGPIGKYGFG